MDNPTTTKSQNQSKEISSGDAYLKLQLDRQTPAVLPIECAQEVLVLPSRRIAPMPNMPKSILGFLNQRSRVFWVVDLAQLLQLSNVPIRAQNYHIAILQVDNDALGLVVEQIKGTIRFTKEQIQSSHGTVPSHLTPYLRGCIPQDNEILLVLEPKAILNCSHLHANKET